MYTMRLRHRDHFALVDIETMRGIVDTDSLQIVVDAVIASRGSVAMDTGVIYLDN